MIGNIIRRARVARGWSQEELGRRLGVTGVMVSSMLSSLHAPERWRCHEMKIDFAHFCHVMFEVHQLVAREAVEQVKAIKDEARQMRVHGRLLRSEEYRSHFRATLAWLRLAP